MSIAIAILTACLFTVETADEEKSEMAQLDGEWSFVSSEHDGHSTSPEALAELKRVARNGEVTIYQNGQMPSKYKFTIDPSKTPKTIDYKYIDGGLKDETRLGIYEVQGDTLKVCTAVPPAKERPSEFTSKPGNGWMLVVCKRDKK